MQLGERVERAGVQVAGLQRDDHRPVDLGERGAQRVRPDPALVVGGDRRRRAEPEVAQGEVDAVVPLGADEHVTRGAPVRPARVQVPAGAGEHVAAGRPPGR